LISSVTDTTAIAKGVKDYDNCLGYVKAALVNDATTVVPAVAN
jgi:hypothetical protein